MLRPSRVEIRQGAELVLIAKFRLGSGGDLVIRQPKINGPTLRLYDMPWRVDEDLDAISFRVLEIDRPGIAVGAGTNSFNFGLCLEHCVQVAEVIEGPG